MSNFKIGDRVQVANNINSNNYHQFDGGSKWQGVITNIYDQQTPYRVKFDNSDFSNSFSAEELRLIND